MLRAVEHYSSHARRRAVPPDALLRRFLLRGQIHNNPQHLRVLANELLGSALAARLGLPHSSICCCGCQLELVSLTEELVVQIGMSRAPCRAGLQFGSRYPGGPAAMPCFDYLPDQQLAEVKNLDDFLGMLVFDKWTCNTNGRQAIYFREVGRSRY